MAQKIPFVNTISFTNPTAVLNQSQALNKVNRYAYITPEIEIKSTEVDLKLGTIKKSTLWKTAKKVIIVTTLVLASAAILSVSIFASAYAFPTFFGIGILCYKLYPLIFHPMDKKYHQETLYRSNLEGILAKQSNLQLESLKDLRKRFSELGIDTKNYKIDPSDDQILKEDQAMSLLIPLLSRFEYWKDQIEKTEKLQHDMSERITEIRERIQINDHYSLSQDEALDLENKISEAYQRLEELSLKIKESETDSDYQKLKTDILEMEKQRKLSDKDKSDMIKELVSLTYKIDDLDEDDSLNFQANSTLLSAIKASYTLDLMHDLTQKKTIGEFGYFNSHLKHIRTALEGTSSGDDYFISHDKQNHITKKELKDHLKDFDYIRQRIFHVNAPQLIQEELA